LKGRHKSRGSGVHAEETPQALGWPTEANDRESIIGYRWIPSPCKIVDTTCIFELSANNSLTLVTSVFESLLKVESRTCCPLFVP
jgi:hypothetical protein